jgi:HlyD family secretion protein
VILLLIPYPIHVSGDFEVITLQRPEVRTLTDGIVSEILVRAGQTVKNGEPVARLLDTYLLIERAKLQAELDSKRASLRLAEKGYRQEEIEKARLKLQELASMVDLSRRQLDRVRQLGKAGIVAAEELERARSEHTQKNKELAQAEQELKQRLKGSREEEIEQARAEVDQLNARVRELDQHLEWTTVLAPIAGIVVTPEHELQAQIGKHVDRGTSLMRIVDPESVVARIQVSENEFGDIAVGHEVELRSFQYPQQVFASAINSIEPTVERPTEFSSTISVLSRLENQDARLRLGSTGKAKIDCGTRFIGYIIYRRFLRSLLIQIWSWY